MKLAKTFLPIAAAAMVLASVGSASAASFVDYSTKSFNKALSSGKTLVVHVHATWCSSCKRQLGPLKTELSKPAFSKVGAFRVNFDTDRDFLRKYRVNTQTTIMIFKKGKLIERSIGVTSAAGIRAVVAKAL